jgi:hypothetical protein
LKNKYGGDDDDDNLGPLLIARDGSPINFKNIWSSLNEEELKSKKKSKEPVDDNNQNNNDDQK